MKSVVEESQINRQENSRKWNSIIKSQATDFCLATGLHGYKYIVQSNRTTTEKWVLHELFETVALIKFDEFLYFGLYFH